MATQPLPSVEHRRYSWYQHVTTSSSRQVEAIPAAPRLFVPPSRNSSSPPPMQQQQTAPPCVHSRRDRRSVGPSIVLRVFTAICNQPHFFLAEEHGHQCQRQQQRARDYIHESASTST